MLNSGCKAAIPLSPPLKTTSAAPVSTAKEIVNNISIANAPAGSSATSTCDKQAHILLDPQPVKLSIETATDWPAVTATSIVGIGSIVTVILVAWITRVNQRSQLRASTATFRQQWMTELRTAVAEFFELIAMTKFEMEEDSEYLKTKDSSKNFSRITFLQSKIGLMLDRHQPYTEKINTLVGEIIEYLKGRRHEKLQESVNFLWIEMNNVLEKAWGDIRNDLEGIDGKNSKRNHI